MRRNAQPIRRVLLRVPVASAARVFKPVFLDASVCDQNCHRN